MSSKRFAREPILNKLRPTDVELHVSPMGKDGWSGRSSRPNKSDGPLATLQGAIQRIRQLKDAGKLNGPVTVWIHPGVYTLTQPLRCGPEDSWPVTFAQTGHGEAIIDGGQRITGWQVTQHNGRTAWVAELPEVAAGTWSIRELFVDGLRAQRPRLPREGLYRMAQVPGLKLPCGWGFGGQTQFICREGDVREFANLGDVEVVYLHFWIEERSPIATFDPVKRLVTMTRPSRTAMVGAHGSQLADYYLDNVFEALSEPGQWYLDRRAGRLYYLPRPGERPNKTQVYAPRLLQLLKLVGELDGPTGPRYVEHIRFRGLTFRHTDWRHPGEDTGGVDPDTNEPFGRGNDASSSQAAYDVPGIIRFHAARYCAVEDCTIEHVGWYGVEIGAGCRGIHVVGNTLRDLGGGGVRINGVSASRSGGKCCTISQSSHHKITDNHIATAGRIFHSAVGVLAMHAHDLEISHNHIHDLYYTGISCGWEWGYQENASYNNHIEFNHIHDIGQGLLSDMGGIYTLGVQPGTVIRNNLIHDVRSAHYGGWCIYPDEGSSHIVIENNVCYDADRQVFHQHYGRENIVRNNIFAFGGEAVATYSRREAHRGFTFERNILITDGKPIWSSRHSPDDDAPRYASDLNLMWDITVQPPMFLFRDGKKLTLTAWQRLGHEMHSKVADPRCRNVSKRDFTLSANSPALAMGFVPIDLSMVGPRKRTTTARR